MSTVFIADVIKTILARHRTGHITAMIPTHCWQCDLAILEKYLRAKHQTFCHENLLRDRLEIP